MFIEEYNSCYKDKNISKKLKPMTLEGCVVRISDIIGYIGRDIEGVEISIFLRETEKNTFKLSLRSNNDVNVSDICLMFGGGGHMRAAGGIITGVPFEKAKEKIITECKKHLK